MFHLKSDDDAPVVATAVVAVEVDFQMGKTYYACVAGFPEPFEAVLLWHEPTKGFKIKPVGHDDTGFVEHLYHSKDAAQTALLAMNQDELSGGFGAHNPSTAATTATNMTAHDNQALELLISRLEKATTSIESHRNAEISALKSSLEQAREQFEKETHSLREKISDQQKELDELHAWDTVNITWKISSFGYTCYSSTFNVAQYAMRMKMQVSGDSRYGYLGFYICHEKGLGYDCFPVQLDGSSMSVVGNEHEDTETKAFSPNGTAVIKEAGSGYGHQDFVARKDLEKRFVNDGKLTLKAKIRVRRLPIANLHLKTN